MCIFLGNHTKTVDVAQSSSAGFGRSVAVLESDTKRFR